jgi:hypothetical protein
MQKTIRFANCFFSFSPLKKAELLTLQKLKKRLQAPFAFICGKGGTDFEPIYSRFGKNIGFQGFTSG